MAEIGNDVSRGIDLGFDRLFVRVKAAINLNYNIYIAAQHFTTLCVRGESPVCVPFLGTMEISIGKEKAATHRIGVRSVWAIRGKADSAPVQTVSIDHIDLIEATAAKADGRSEFPFGNSSEQKVREAEDAIPIPAERYTLR